MRILNIILMLVLPLPYIGILNRTKALWGGRKGAPILQPIYDIIRLMKKREIISISTSPVFTFAPFISLACVIFAGLLVPMTGYASVFSFEGSFILFAYIMGLGKFFNIIAALDTASSFEGMGASREAFFTIIPEPAFFMIFGSISIFSGFLTFEDIFTMHNSGFATGTLITMLVVIVLFIMLLVEGSRIPVDDPNTHLELTMIHEVMILDNSGPQLGLIQYASAIKMLLYSTLIMGFIIPPGLPLFYNIPAYIAGVFTVALAVGTVESMVARFRIVRVPDFIFSCVAISFVVMFIILLYHFGARR